jgi:hypothetical protein
MHKAVVWTMLLSFLAALLPPPAAAELTPEQYFVIAERIAGLDPARREQVLQGMSATAQGAVRKILAERFTPTHGIESASMQVEVDVGDRGQIDAVRIWFTARDPAVPPEPATLALRPRADVEEALGAFTTAAVTPACGGPPPSPLEQFRQLTPEELKELERRFHIPLTATGATQAGQQALILSGIRAAHLGSHLVQAAVAAFGAGAVAGATVVFRTGLIGPLEFAVGSLAARTFVVVVGGVGGSLIGLGALAVVLAFEIGRRHWAKAEPTVALATPEECAPVPEPPDDGSSVPPSVPPPPPDDSWTFPPSPTGDVGDLFPQTDEQWAGRWVCSVRSEPDGTLVDALPCVWEYPTVAACLMTQTGQTCGQLDPARQALQTSCCPRPAPLSLVEINEPRWFRDVLYDFSQCQCNYILPSWLVESQPQIVTFPIFYTVVPCEFGGC